MKLNPLRWLLSYKQLNITYSLIRFSSRSKPFSGGFLASHLDSNWMLLYEMSVDQLEPFIQHFVKWTGEHIRKRRINLTWFRNVCLFYLIISVVFRRILSPSSPQDCTSIKPFFRFSSDRDCFFPKIKSWNCVTYDMIIKPAHITPATLNKRLLGTEEEAKSANLVEQRQRTLIQYWI